MKMQLTINQLYDHLLTLDGDDLIDINDPFT